MDKLVNFLKSNTNITRLILRCSRINYEGIKELAQLAHLTSLDLSCSYVGTEGAKILASGNLINLTVHSNGKSLYLAGGKTLVFPDVD